MVWGIGSRALLQLPRTALSSCIPALRSTQLFTRPFQNYLQDVGTRSIVSVGCVEEGLPLQHSVQVEVADTLKVAALVQSFRSRGHLAAQLDPLNRVSHGPWLSEVGITTEWADEELVGLLHRYNKHNTPDSRAHCVAKALQLQGATDATRQFFLGGALPAGDPAGRQWWTLPELLKRMQESYCGTLTVELGHLNTREEQRWVAQRIEGPRGLAPAQQRDLLRSLVQAEAFERFLGVKFPKSKKFGLEGCEAVLPGIQALVRRCAESGVQRMEVGMAHRGRLNLLCNLLRKPPGAIFSEMEGLQSEFHVGDVKYHLGQSATLDFPPLDGSSGEPARIRVSIAPNPSHLEAVNPVVLGMVRAEQTRLGDDSRGRVAGLLLHGDAAFAGLGIVAECLQLADVPGFTTGGTLHVVVNNQVGFTTEPCDARSSPHPTDAAKAVGAPILHVNADDPEAVAQACLLAADWRAKFRRDVIVDVVGYRRNGHNELDDPRVTLPQSYRLIDTHPTVLEQYSQHLLCQGVITPEELAGWQEEAWNLFEAEYTAFQEGQYRESPHDWLAASWQGDALQALSEGSVARFRQEPTGLPLRTLQWVGEAICTVPPSFPAHPEVERILERRRAMVKDADSRVDWAMAEALAFGALSLHGGVRPPGVDDPNYFDYDPKAGLNAGSYSVRLTGQDVERGTFNQRHAVLYRQDTGRRLVLLNCIKQESQERVEVWNSPLSEAAVLGYEYGYSLGCAGSALVLWEAQFGDFANNAQTIIDQFIAAGEERWGQKSALVLMLPHGYDGQGPDHSSARIERFLQLCNDDPDHLPGHGPDVRRQMRATFDALAKDHGGVLNRDQVGQLLRSVGVDQDEALELVWHEMGVAPGAGITADDWSQLMVQYMRRNAEKTANLFVVNATTPAQVFHALRRQMNRPYVKPLVLISPKFMLHHSQATSALQDFAVGKFFNRVIDDGKGSDNTRHLARSPRTSEPFLLPPERISRVILCSGQVYYQLSQMRRARRIRDIVLVRLEQISPFPHDLVIKVVRQYRNAELVWCQEEPKNMGAWRYVAPRLRTAMRAQRLAGSDAPIFASRVSYVGRPVAASAATASLAIHREEVRNVLETALAPRIVVSGGDAVSESE